MSTNVARAGRILEQLGEAGVSLIAACAGARNAPLLEVLDRSTGVRIAGFFEERSAGFFALGRAKATGEPAAVITTSGTAAAELLPAVIEAHYSGVPLIVVTADRPRRFRGTGAPQAIEQATLFGPYVERALDLEEGTELALDRWSRTRPLHVNSCFSEPLIDAAVPEIAFAPGVESPGPATSETDDVRTAEALSIFRRLVARPVAVVGELPRAIRNEVADFLLTLRIPAWLEAHSGLREDPRLDGLRIHGGDRVLTEAADRGLLDGVLRLGGVPTVRTWRDLDGRLEHVPVLSLSHRPFPGLGRDRPCHDLAHLRGLASATRGMAAFDAPDALLERGTHAAAILDSLCSRYPRSETALVRDLSTRIPDPGFVYLGNSQPIRQWDRAARPPAGDIRYGTNRGANGIDGQLSTFLGMCLADAPNVALVGDLTALYDAPAPWALRHLPDHTDGTFVVMNNGGGGIFEPIFGHDRFRNPHDVRFRGWAEQWGLEYEEWTEIPERPKWSGRRVVEIRPDAEQTRAFLRAEEDAWNDPSA